MIISICSVQLDPGKLHALTDMPTMLAKMSYNHFRYYELLRKVLTRHCRSTLACVKTDISKRELDMEQHVPIPRAI